MAEVVTLKVNVDKSQLGALQADINKLQSKTVTIKVNASGFAALDKSIVKNINSVSRFVNAAARLEKTQAQVRIAQERTAQATQRRITEEARLATQQTRLATQNAKTATEEARLATQTQKTATEQAKAATQTQRTATERAKLATQTQRTATEEARLATQQERTRTAQARGASRTQNANSMIARSAGQAAKSTSVLGDSLGNVVKKMVAWQVMGDLIAKPIAAFKDAIATMKAVDSELVNVGKVTKWPEERLKAMGEQAYKTASAYGVAANEYLSSVTEFTRAGYLEQSEALAELATKTQIVGDTTAEVANQFLLAVDKGYQMGGSVEKLSAVLDGANEIGNNFATSIPKIAEGLGKVAPIGAQAKVGIDELSAAIGTVTAVTQRSGTEAATALRALFLNIMGDTKTEIDEGVTWTTGEIAGLRDVLNLYASDVVAAADATGSLINPMEAIGALSQSMKDGVLTEQKLMEMVSDIGGKLRTSQLLALIQNWDMYEAMLEKYENAAGSADREVERAMDSWERKSEVLKNTWTQFVSHLVETDAIKGAITGVTEVIDTLDTDLGHTAMGMVGLATAVNLLGKAGKGIAGMGLVKAFKDFFLLTTEFGVAESAMASFGTFFKTNPIFTGAIAAAGLYALIKGLREIAPTVENATKELESLQEQMESEYGAGSEYDDLKSRVDSLTSGEQKRLSVLEAQKAVLEGQIQDQAKLTFDRFQGSLGIGNDSIDYTQRIDVKRLNAAKDAQDALNQSFKDSEIGAEDYTKGLDNLINRYQDYYDQLHELAEAGFLDQMTQSERDFLSMYEEWANLRNTLSGVEKGFEDVAIAMELFQDRTTWNGKDVFNDQALRAALRQAGATGEQIRDVVANIQQEGGIVLDIHSNAEEILPQLKELGVAAEDANGEITIDTASLDTLLQKLGFSEKNIDEFYAKLEQTPEVSFNGERLEGLAKSAQQAATASSDLNRTLGFVGETAAAAAQASGLPTLGNQATDATGKVNETTQAMNTLDKSDANPSIKVDNTGALSKINVVQAAMDRLKSKTISINVRESHMSVNQNGTLVFNGKTAAEGTDHAPGGKTLVNEEGPEIIREGSRARIAAGGLPTITALKPGAQVFTAEETEDILRGDHRDILLPSRAAGDAKYAHSFNPDAGGNSGGGGGASSGGGKGTSSAAKSSSSSKKTSSSSGNGGTDSKLDALQEDLDLLRAQYSFLEASGAGAEALTAKSREIQAALNNINNHLRSANGEQKDILANSTDWWKELETIQKVQQEAFQKEREALEAEIELGQKLGVSTESRLSRLKQIQDSLAREAEYLRSIGAAQEEINQLSIQWWETQEDIREVQQDLWDELEDAVDKELKRAQIARDEEIDALDRRLQEMKDARDAKEDELTLEEKLLKVEEARAALENAQNERTIRTYNAASGQWEWVADAKSVEDAQKNLAEAEKDLEEYRADLAYEEAVKAIERRKEAINAAYDALEEGWEDIIESVQEPTREIGDILADLAKNGTPLMKEQVENTRRLLEDLNNYISSAISTNTGDSFYGANGSLGEYGAGGGLSSKDYSKDTTDYSALMYRAKDLAEFNYWAEQRTNKMNAQGIDPTAAGFKTNAEIFKEWESGKQKGEQSSGSTKRPTSSTGASSGSSSSSSSGNKVVKVTENGTAPKGLGVGDSVVTGGGTYTITGVNKDGSYSSVKSSNTTTQTYKGKYDKYDQGGVLRGLGGIKATASNEMILPPDITAKMLTPTSNEVFEQRMKELGLLYGAPQTLQSPAAPQGARAGGDTYNNGATYQYGNITLTESQAKGMSVYELTQMARNLRLFNGR